MSVIQTVPKALEKALGREATEEFVGLLNQVSENIKTDVIETVSDKFHRHVTDEVTKVRLEIADVRLEVANLRNEMADLRSEFKADISEIHKLLSAQTRWILVVVLAGAVIYPIVAKLIDKLLG